MERIDRYEVESMLGAGAFATVWLARDPVLDLRVAIKVLADNWSRDPGIRARFIEEARVLWQADSTRIVRVHHVGELDDGRPYFVMGWADRGTLRERMTERFATGSTFSIEETASIAAELCRAVRDVHGLGRIHRDIKPANVLIRTTVSRTSRSISGLASDEQLVLADFGLAREIDASSATMVSGSPAYVAPEQAGGVARLDERADIYPLGLIMIELATGSSPAERTTMLDAAMTGRLDISGHLARAGTAMPPRLYQLAALMVEPDPEARPASAGDIAAELAALASSPPGPHGTPPVAAATDLGPEPGAAPPTTIEQTASPPVAPAADTATTPGSPPVVQPPAARSTEPVASPAAFGSYQHQPTEPVASPAGFGPPGQPPTEPVASPAGFGPSGQPPTDPIAPPVAAGGSRLPLILAVAAVVVVAVVGAVAAMTFGGGDGQTAAPTTTGPPAPSEVTTSTAPPSPTTQPPPIDAEPTEVPFPEFSALEPGSDDTRAVANVANSVADVASFYESLADPNWRTVSSSPTADGFRFELASAYRTATVTLSPAAVTAGEGITRIEVRYSEG